VVRHRSSLTGTMSSAILRMPWGLRSCVKREWDRPEGRQNAWTVLLSRTPCCPAPEEFCHYTTAMAEAEVETDPKRVRVVYLVSCVKRKRAEPAPARDLYDKSDWFRKARKYVEPTGCPWFILSAKYGLVSPNQWICPYEKALGNMRMEERRAWASRVKVQTDQHLPPADRIVVLAGMPYRRLLMDYLQQEAPCVQVPMEGMRMGGQLQYLARNAGHEPLC